MGVIGHVDHGKTALVRALTGTDTSRLAEEKRRGISIVLGFAHMALPEGGVADLIDMPGHERFVRTMVSGATGVAAVLLVVAANEGVQPQTVEHVDIASLLGISRAVIAVTKADLAPPGPAAAAAEALARAAGLHAAPAIATSALTGAGLPALREAIAAALAATPPVEDSGFAYLPVDRAFTLAGHGTVVTGTLRRGPIAPGDTLTLLPSGEAARVRTVQVHGRPVPRALPGQRTALNLRGTPVEAVGHGAALCTPGLLAPASWLTVALRSVPGAPPLATGTALRLLHGTAEAEARLRLLDRDVLAPGADSIAQLHVRAEATLPAREGFILRRASPACTVAGGTVLDPAATRIRRFQDIGRLAALRGARPEAIVAQAAQAAGAPGTSLAALARLAGIAPARAAAALEGHPVLVRDGQVIAAAAVAALAGRLPALLARHAEGLSPEALAAALPGTGAALLAEACARLLATGTLGRERGKLRLRVAERDDAEAAAEAARTARLLAALRGAGLAPPDPATLAPDPPSRRTLDRLVREGALIRAPDRVQKRDVLFHRDAVDAARAALRPLLAAPGLLVREAGEALGISRKYSVPLLEHLDAVHFTRRVGDRRVLAQGG